MSYPCRRLLGQDNQVYYCHIVKDSGFGPGFPDPCISMVDNCDNSCKPHPHQN